MILGMTSTVITFLLTSGSGADVVVLWTLDPIYVGLSVNIMVLVKGSRIEAAKHGGGDSRGASAGGIDQRARVSPYLAIVSILGVVLLYYAFWLWALNA